MTKLPSAGVIQDLTKENILLVAEAYLDQMLCVPAQCDHTRAKAFIMTALRRAQRDYKLAWGDFMEHTDRIETMLTVVPHVKLKGDCSSRDIEPEAWLHDNEIVHRVIWFKNRWVYLFDNFDDALLFKLKWYRK
jgi:hypothetical protein